MGEIEPQIPPAKRGGNKRTIDVREVLNGIMYTLHGLPVAGDAEGPAAKQHGERLLCGRWHYDRTFDRIHHALYVKCREQTDREASPTAAIIDSQSVKGAGKGGLDRSAWL